MSWLGWADWIGDWWWAAGTWSHFCSGSFLSKGYASHCGIKAVEKIFGAGVERIVSGSTFSSVGARNEVGTRPRPAGVNSWVRRMQRAEGLAERSRRARGRKAPRHHQRSRTNARPLHRPHERGAHHPRRPPAVDLPRHRLRRTMSAIGIFSQLRLFT